MPQPFAGASLWNPYAHLAGTWQKANLHAHGHAWAGMTNGKQTDEEVVRAYKQRGYAVAGVSNYASIAAFRGVDDSLGLAVIDARIQQHAIERVGHLRAGCFDHGRFSIDLNRA